MGLATVLAKVGSKALAKKLGLGATTMKREGVTYTGFHPIEVPPTPFAEKIADLAKDRGLTEPYVSDIISQAKGRKSLEAIQRYLESSRNDMPFNVTKRLLGRLARKLDVIKQTFAEHIDIREFGEWFV